MSEEQINSIIKDISNKIIVYVIGGLILTMILGGFTMVKIFNVSQKADKAYVDGVYNSAASMIRVMENRTLVLEQMMEAEKQGNKVELDNLKIQLQDLNKQWADHMRYHLDKTRTACKTDKLFYFGQELPAFCNKLIL